MGCYRACIIWYTVSNSNVRVIPTQTELYGLGVDGQLEAREFRIFGYDGMHLARKASVSWFLDEDDGGLSNGHGF